MALTVFLLVLKVQAAVLAAAAAGWLVIEARQMLQARRLTRAPGPPSQAGC